jgi:nucleoside-diphosphate-sugar epimerase
MASGRVLVTGATGFIGRKTIAELASRGISFAATDLHEHPEIPDLLVGDLLDEEFVEGLMREPISAIIHLAGILPTAARQDPLAATRVNIDGSCRLLHMAREAAVPRFVFGSSLGVYGGNFGLRAVSENTPAAPDEVYGAGKLYVEYVGNLLQSEYFAFAALRIATTIGEGVTNSASPWRSELVAALHSDQPTIVEIPYADDSILPLVHVIDVARSLVLLAVAEPAPRGVFNSPAQSVTIAELRDLIASANPNVSIKTGTRRKTGIPAFMDSRKLAALGYRPVALHEHFQSGANQRTTSSRRS